ncbi:MAG: SH3 domain-containing protein [Pseudomonadota bacterium]
MAAATAWTRVFNVMLLGMLGGYYYLNYTDTPDPVVRPTDTETAVAPPAQRTAPETALAPEIVAAPQDVSQPTPKPVIPTATQVAEPVARDTSAETAVEEPTVTAQEKTPASEPARLGAETVSEVSRVAPKPAANPTEQAPATPESAPTATLSTTQTSNRTAPEIPQVPEIAPLTEAEVTDPNDLIIATIQSETITQEAPQPPVDPNADSIADANSDTTTRFYVVTGTRVNARAGPDTSFDVLARLERGEALVSLGESQGIWQKVIVLSSGQEVWMHGDFIAEN